MNNTELPASKLSLYRAIIPVFAMTLVAFALLFAAEPARAADPSPVNPPGPIPLILADADGNSYEVFTPEEGGSIVGDDYSLIAEPGDVPSAYIVGVRMTKGGVASNAGMVHHRYTLGGNYYVVDAINEHRITPSRGFRFRNPVDACVPMPKMFSANIVDVRLIATDAEGISQTVLNSGVRVIEGNLSVCGYVGSVPTILAVGMEGSPGPALPSPTPSPEVVLPATGGASPGTFGILVMLLAGVALAAGGLIHSARAVRRGRVTD